MSGDTVIGELGRAFAKLERQKQAVLAAIESWPVERLQFRATAAAWSALNVVDHLVRVETIFVTSLPANLQRKNRLTWRNRIGAVMVTLIMRSPLRVKVPAGAQSSLPAGTAGLPELRAKWGEVRLLLKQLIDPVQPANLRSGVLDHPVSGWMSPGQALTFLSAHIRHHRYQLANLKRQTENARYSEIHRASRP